MNKVKKTPLEILISDVAQMNKQIDSLTNENKALIKEQDKLHRIIGSLQASIANLQKQDIRIREAIATLKSTVESIKIRKSIY